MAGELVYDDVFFIQQHPLIRDLSNAPTMFASAFWESSSQPLKAFYRPLTVLSYAANFALGGDDPLGYHLLNVALHAANAVLVFALTCILTRNRLFSVAVGLLFGLHPAATEVVAWVSGRGDVLGTCFSLTALTIYVWAHPPSDRGDSLPRKIRYLQVFAVLAFLAALYAKESAVTVIPVLVVYEVTMRSGVRKAAFRLLPFLVVVISYLICRVFVLDGLTVTRIHFADNPLGDELIGPRALTGVLLFGKYLTLLVFPLRLAVDHSYSQIPVVRTWWNPSVLLSAGAGIVLVGIWWRSWRRDRVLCFGLGMFFVPAG